MEQEAGRLTEGRYWDAVHVAEGVQRAPSPPRRGLRGRLKTWLGPRWMAAASDYDQYRLWEVILPRYLEGMRGKTAVEVGSAPGEFLVRLHRRFGLVPHGIEYSEVGAELNRRVFSDAGVDPAGVIHADFFSPEVEARYKESFDVVLSRGFIEHFDDPREAVRRHLGLLRPGGILLVSVPNLRGVNFAASWLLDREVLRMHNVGIMDRDRYASLFPGDVVEPLLCTYYGTFSFRLYNARAGSWGRLPLEACMKAQVPLNMAFRVLLREGGLESRWCSPNLLFVGRKR